MFTEGAWVQEDESLRIFLGGQEQHCGQREQYVQRRSSHAECVWGMCAVAV